MERPPEYGCSLDSFYRPLRSEDVCERKGKETIEREETQSLKFAGTRETSSRMDTRIEYRRG